MVKKSKKYTRKVSYKKLTGNVLSNSKIYGYVNARSQARQIAALKRKIDFVYKNTRPDLETACCWATKLFDNQSSGMNSTFMYAQINPGNNMFNNQDGAITGSYIPAPSGNQVKIFGGYLKATCIYSNNYYQQNDAGSCNRYATVRMLVVLRKASFNTNPAQTDPSSYIDDYSISGSSYHMNHLRPLRQGIQNECKILYDKYKTIDQTNPKCEFKVPIGRFNQNYMENDNYPKHTLQAYICVDGLAFDASHTSYVANVECNALWKVNYCYLT